MSMIYYDSYVNQSSGIALNGTAGVADRQVADAILMLKVVNPALAGIITVNLKWRDRTGAVRTRPGIALSLITAAETEDRKLLWFDDTGVQSGVPFEWEVLTAGVLGSFTYNVAVGLEHKFIGN